MIRLLFIVPYPELEETVKYVLENHPERKRLNVEVKTMTVEETPDVPAAEYDAIIARGYTAQKTSAAYSSIPTITLQISGYDIVRALSECCQLYHPKKIAICGFGNRLYEAKDICRFFGVEAEVYAPVENHELPQAIQKAREAGCDALVGGYSANILAREAGLPAVVIKTGADTLAQAMDEAIHTVDTIRQERILSQMYKTIIYSSDAGLLYVDCQGIIQVRNYVIRKMNGDVSLMKRPLKDAIPWLEKIFLGVVSSKEAEEARLVKIPGTRNTVSVKCTPVIVNKKISGVVFNLSDVTQIQDLESQIRRKLSERGLKARYRFQDILHESSVIERTISMAKRYAASDSNVIIVGETGTGKELFAQSIHNESKRRNGPFVAINCAALPENLLESELFGYVEGAFTGTSKGGKMGLFEQAHGGTLFLDEIEEISMSIQSKLLRVLQERQVRRVGDNKVINVDVRVISATNKSISHMADNGEFRRDLVYRLDVLRLFLPPLRERENDMELLFLHRMKELETEPLQVEEEALALLHTYPFRGNVRELYNLAERIFVIRSGGVITGEMMQEALYPGDIGKEKVKPAFESEQEQIQRILLESKGNRSKAAEMLGIDRSTLRRRMKKYKIL